MGHYAGGLSTVRNTDAAVAEALASVEAGLAGSDAEIAVAFASPHHGDSLGRITAELIGRGIARHAVACTGEAIIGEGREVEGVAALSVWAWKAPGTTVRPIRFEAGDDGAISGWPADIAAPAAVPEGRILLLLGEPFSFPVDAFLKAAAAECPGLRVVGGMASGGSVPGQNRVALDGAGYPDGGVGLWIDGPTPIRTVVSQGCRPIGRPFVVTRVERNMIRELGRRPALEVLRELFDGLDPGDRQLVQGGLHIGRVIDEYRENFGRGDFLVRNVLGADDSGGVAISDLVRVGQTVQFHVRDAVSADEDLQTLLRADAAGRRAAGALIFSCNGRGSRLFDAADHDASAVRSAYGPVPAAGFFAMGEIGPVGGKNFAHGFTASVVVFEGASED